MSRENFLANEILSPPIKTQFNEFSIFFLFLFAEFWGSRHFVTFMLFLGMANAYVMRTNMSVAIVAMVNHTYIEAGAVEVLDDECPDYNETNLVSVTKSHQPSTVRRAHVRFCRVC